MVNYVRRATPLQDAAADRVRRKDFVLLLWSLLLGVAPLLSAGSTVASAAPAAQWRGGQDVRINDPGELPSSQQYGEEAYICNIQSEVSLARWGDTVVAGWNDGSQCATLLRRKAGVAGSQSLSLSGVGYSRDGGATWDDGGFLPTPPGVALFGDPVLAAGPGGIFYYATLYEDTARRISVARSTDGGKSWGVPVIASGNLPATPTSSNPLAARTVEDKPWIAVDTTRSPYWGHLYVAWTEVGAQPGDNDDAVYFSRSADQGLTFADPVKLSLPVEAVPGAAKEERPGIGVQVAVGPEGQVYVAWVHRAGLRIWLAKSDDGGVSFGDPQAIARVFPVGHHQHSCGTTVLNGDIRIFNWIAMAVDTSDSPDRGTIYLAAAHDETGMQGGTNYLLNPGDESDIAWTYSRDGGVTWANLDARGEIDRIINGDNTPTDQFHPALAVDPLGRIAVSWYDRSISQRNWEMSLVTRISSDGGRTFGPTLEVGDASFPPSRTNPNTGGFSGCYMGEYNGLTAGDDEFLLAWGDNRDGLVAETAARDLHPDPNVYFDRVTLRADAEEAPGPEERPQAPAARTSAEEATE